MVFPTTVSKQLDVRVSNEATATISKQRDVRVSNEANRV